MAVRKGVAPTKTSMLKLQEELKFARQGYELLDQKRNILINELLTLVDLAVENEERAYDALKEAYASLELASRDIGKLSVQSLVGAIRIDSDMTIRQRKVMGVRLPLVETSFEEYPPLCQPGRTEPAYSSRHRKFQKSLENPGGACRIKSIHNASGPGS